MKLPKGGKRSWTAYNKYLDLSKYLAFALGDILVPKYGTKIFRRGCRLFLKVSLKFNPYSKVTFRLIFKPLAQLVVLDRKLVGTYVPALPQPQVKATRFAGGRLLPLKW